MLSSRSSLRWSSPSCHGCFKLTILIRQTSVCLEISMWWSVWTSRGAIRSCRDLPTSKLRTPEQPGRRMSGPVSDPLSAPHVPNSMQRPRADFRVLHLDNSHDMKSHTVFRAIRGSPYIEHNVRSVLSTGPRLRAPFVTATAQFAKQMPPRPKPPPEEEIEESFLKGSGPGGQKIVRLRSLFGRPCV